MPCVHCLPSQNTQTGAAGAKFIGLGEMAVCAFMQLTGMVMFSIVTTIGLRFATRVSAAHTHPYAEIEPHAFLECRRNTEVEDHTQTARLRTLRNAEIGTVCEGVSRPASDKVLSPQCAYRAQHTGQRTTRIARSV